jgi:hypothetical protein
LPSGSARTCQLSAPVWPTSAGAEGEQALELGLLVTVGRVDVEVQAELAGPRVGARAEDEGGQQPEAGVGQPVRSSYVASGADGCTAGTAGSDTDRCSDANVSTVCGTGAGAVASAPSLSAKPSENSKSRWSSVRAHR